MTTIEFLRQFRLGGYAIFDFAASFLGIFLLSPLLSKLAKKLHLDVPKISWLYLTLPVSIFIHLLTKSFTPMTMNFLDIHGHYLLKVVMLALLVLGIKDMKIIKKSSKKR